MVINENTGLGLTTEEYKSAGYALDNREIETLEERNKRKEERKMNNLSLIKYEIKEINNIANFLNSENNELDEETIQDTRESIKYLLEEKSEQLELILKEQEIKEEKCKEISKYYAEKSKETKEKRDALKRMIMEAMENLRVKKIETETGTFNNAPALIIENEELVPDKFKTIIQETKIEKN